MKGKLTQFSKAS